MASSNFKMEDENFQRQMEGSPELVKALQFYDEERDLVWIPSPSPFPSYSAIS